MINKENRVRDDLRFEEFEKLACRMPDLEGDWIYRLEQTELGDVPESPYPKFEVGMTHTYYFRSFDKAESFMRSNHDNIQTYRNVISQVPVGKECWQGGASWLYDSEFNLIDFTITTEQEDKPYNSHFFGRPANRQRFEEGDIVEVLDGENVSLALLVANPPDVEWCWHVYCRSMEDKHFQQYHLDYSDDSAIVLEGPDYSYHRHVSPLFLMKPSLPIAPELADEIKSWHERSKMAEEEEAKNGTGMMTTKPVKKRGETVGDFSPLNLSIHYDKGIEVPHFHIYDGYGLDVALRMDAPEYYDHEGICGRLNDNQIEALVDYLSAVELGKTKWWYIIRDWHDDAYGKRISLSLPLPDYRKLKNFNNK